MTLTIKILSIKQKKWIKTVLKEAGNVPIILVGNKSDKENEREVSKENGMNLAEEKNVQFFETSAKDDVNIKEIFESMNKHFFKKKGLSEKLKDSQDDYGDSKNIFKIKVTKRVLVSQEIIKKGWVATTNKFYPNKEFII